VNLCFAFEKVESRIVDLCFIFEKVEFKIADPCFTFEKAGGKELVKEENNINLLFLLLVLGR
jgi:hypothetical protein